jgi:hypothetical protein
MKIEYHRSRYMSPQVVDGFQSLADAASVAVFDLEYQEAWPLKIVAGGTVVWQNPGLQADIASSLKCLMPTPRE